MTFSVTGPLPSGGTVDLTLAPGQAVVLTGPSGCGKSRFLRACADLDPHDLTVSLADQPQGSLCPMVWRRQVRYMPAESAWWAEGVSDHFFDPAWARDQGRSVALDETVFDQPVSQLSTGQRQRLSLLLTLERQPKVLLLDEPTAALDEENRDRVVAMLQQFGAEGGYVLAVSHDTDLIQSLKAQHYSYSEQGITPISSQESQL